MRWRNSLPLAAVVWSMAWFASAREWRSSDGRRTVDAAFVALKDGQLLLDSGNGKPAAHAITLFSEADQKFAHLAQQASEAGQQLGPKVFEIQHVLEDGWICRMGHEAASQKGLMLFTGETFVFLTPDAGSGQRGMQWKNISLYPAGIRTFHPAKGEPEVVRAYAASAEQSAVAQQETLAASAGDPDKQAPPVHEPVIEVILSHGLGLAVSKVGHVLVDATLTKDANALTVHANKNEFPAKVVKHDEKTGLALLSCNTGLEPGRFASRKPLELGQAVFAVTMSLNSTRKNFSQPTVSKGIVSLLKAEDERHFQHDAALPPQHVGGFLLGEKGDVLGVFFAPPQNVGDKAGTPSPHEGVLSVCLRSEALADILQSVPNTTATKPAAGTNELDRSVALLRDASVVVIARREVKREPVVAGGGAGFSLSGSGTRHNARCRYFRADKACGPNEGQPCKICGG